MEVAEFDDLDNVDNSEEVANMKVYYGDQDYLERRITKPLLRKADGLNNVIKCLIEYVDDSLNKNVFV